MSQFPDFEELYGPPQDVLKPSERVLETYRGKLPDELIAHWQEVGIASYGEGLLWLVEPSQFEGVVEDWLETVDGTPLVFLRTAFAHLYLWHNDAVYSLDVHRGSLSEVTKKIGRIFSLLCDDEIKEKMVRASLFDEVRGRIGPPDRDECYAFEPAIALGGPGTADTVRRVKIREHLGVLAQLVGNA